MADDTTSIDDRLRRAWADLDDSDHELEAAPPAVWADIERALGPSPLPARARSRTGMPRLLLVAAAVLAVVGLGALAVTVLGGEAVPVESQAVLSTDDIDAPPGPHGEARLVADEGGRSLELAVEELPALGSDDVLEVWLIDPDSGGLLSLGLTEGRSTLPVPDGVDTSRFSVVDVSIEPTDGDPGHSSVSVVRGPLEAV